jgi:hypothetical protein
VFCTFGCEFYSIFSLSFLGEEPVLQGSRRVFFLRYYRWAAECFDIWFWEELERAMGGQAAICVAGTERMEMKVRYPKKPNNTFYYSLCCKVLLVLVIVSF